MIAQLKTLHSLSRARHLTAVHPSVRRWLDEERSAGCWDRGRGKEGASVEPSWSWQPSHPGYIWIASASALHTADVAGVRGRCVVR